MKKTEKRFYLFLLIWLCADFIQAIFTNIHADEAYYALYGQFLDWGYYDHPPMVALLTYLSQHIASGGLSIRLCTVMLHAATVWLIWKTILDKKAGDRDVNEFFLLASSLVMFVLYGFITTPDAPLLFFTAFFFYLYKHYLEKPSLTLALLIGLDMAGMMYSKYMAVLVIGFVLLSNLKLLKDWRMWMSVGIAALLFVPHVLWQIHHDFPSLKYHLLLRKDSFSWAYPLEFLPNQLLVFNPVCFILALYFCWKERKNKNPFVKACVFTCVGFIAFFWLMTINGHAEPHWTIAITIPMLYLLYYNTREEIWRKRLIYFVLPIFVLLMVARVWLCTPYVPEFTGMADRQAKMEAIHDKCGHVPVVFYSSFQNPSLYRYFTEENATALSSLYTRPTQYDILQLDKDWQGKEVYVISSSHFPHAESLSQYELYYGKIPHFQGTNRIDIDLKNQQIEGDILTLDVTFHNHYAEVFDFHHPECPVTVMAAYLKGDDYLVEYCEIVNEQNINAHDSINTQLRFRLHRDLPFAICLSNQLNLSVNSRVIPAVSQ